jgi:hypothetical protein
MAKLAKVLHLARRSRRNKMVIEYDEKGKFFTDILEGELLHTSDFLAVNREQIVWLMPVEKRKSLED